MKIKRLTDPDDVYSLIDYCTFPDERNRSPFLSRIYEMLERTPESLLILAGFDDHDDNTICAFIIAQNPGPTSRVIYLAQVWSHPENHLSWYKPFLAGLIMWTLSLGKEGIRAETQRDTKALYRRFGFEPYMEIVKLDIPSTQLDQLLHSYSEEILSWAASSNQV